MKRLSILLIILATGLVAVPSVQAMTPFPNTKVMKNTSAFVSKLQANRGSTITDKTRTQFRSRLGKFRQAGLQLTTKRFQARKNQDFNRIQNGIWRDLDTEDIRLENEIKVLRQENRERKVRERHRFTGDRRKIVEDWADRRISPVRQRLRKAKKSRKKAIRKQLRRVIRQRNVLIRERLVEFRAWMGQMNANEQRNIDRMQADSDRVAERIRDAWRKSHQDQIRKFADLRATERSQVAALHSRGLTHISTMPRRKK